MNTTSFEALNGKPGLVASMMCCCGNGGKAPWCLQDARIRATAACAT